MKTFNVNGVKVAYHYLPTKLTNVQILTNVGSATESKEEQGYCHILEHNFFKGSKKYPGPLDIQTASNDIGAKLNAWTHVDTTCYHITALNDFFSQAFGILADMYQHPLFPEDEFNKELNPILSEMRQYEDDPGTYLSNRMMPLLVGEDAGHPTIGTESSVSEANVDKIRKFHATYYGGNNVMISIVGGVSEEEVVSTISNSFTLPQASSPPVVPKVKYGSGTLTLRKEGVTEAVYFLCYPALNRFHPDRYKQSLMTYVLGGNDSGMLHERIREELGMSCYGIYASQAWFDSFNLLEVSTGIAPEQIDQCHDEVMKQISKLMNSKVEEQRLNRAKASLRTSIALSSESSVGYNNTIAVPLLKGITENPLEKLLSNVEKITTDDIMEMAQKTFNVEPYKAVLLPV